MELHKKFLEKFLQKKENLHQSGDTEGEKIFARRTSDMRLI